MRLMGVIFNIRSYIGGLYLFWDVFVRVPLNGYFWWIFPNGYFLCIFSFPVEWIPNSRIFWYVRCYESPTVRQSVTIPPWREKNSSVHSLLELLKNFNVLVPVNVLDATTQMGFLILKLLILISNTVQYHMLTPSYSSLLLHIRNSNDEYEGVSV